MSTGKIAAIGAAGGCFLIAILAIFFFVRKKNRRNRRAHAEEKFGRPGSMFTGYGAAMENDGGLAAGGMVERKESYNSGRSREMGGPRPPTVRSFFSLSSFDSTENEARDSLLLLSLSFLLLQMIESGRAGMGAGRSIS